MIRSPENDPEVRAVMATFGFDALQAVRHVAQRHALARRVASERALRARACCDAYAQRLAATTTNPETTT